MPNQSSSENISRLLPGLRAEYAIVSMPSWAWHWLDQFVSTSYPQGYSQFLRECASVLPSDACLPPMLEDFARSYRDGVCAVANDTWKTKAEEGIVAKPRKAPTLCLMPKAQYLFRFLPHATRMECIRKRGPHRL